MKSYLALICILTVIYFEIKGFIQFTKHFNYLIQVGSAIKQPLPIRTQLLSMRKLFTLQNAFQ